MTAKDLVFQNVLKNEWKIFRESLKTIPGNKMIFYLESFLNE